MNNENIEKISPVKQSNRLSYKDLIVWQKSIEFASIVIDHAENLASTGSSSDLNTDEYSRRKRTIFNRRIGLQ